LAFSDRPVYKNLHRTTGLKQRFLMENIGANKKNLQTSCIIPACFMIIGKLFTAGMKSANATSLCKTIMDKAVADPLFFL
jgi:hypothetical protein